MELGLFWWLVVRVVGKGLVACACMHDKPRMRGIRGRERAEVS